MSDECHNFAILGYDTKKDCFEAERETQGGETSTNSLNTGDILAIVFAVIIFGSTVGMIYYFGKRLLTSINRFLAACQRVANTFSRLRNPLTKFLFRNNKTEMEKTPEKPKQTKVDAVKIKTEKKVKKKKNKKVTINSTPKPKSFQVTAEIEPVISDNQVSFIYQISTKR